MLSFVEDRPVGSGPLGHPEEGCGRVGVGRFVGPVQGVFHTVDTVTLVEDGQRVLVLFSMEDWNLPLVNLHDWIEGGGPHWDDGVSSSWGPWNGVRRACGSRA